MLHRRFASELGGSCCQITRPWPLPSNSAHSNRCFPAALTWVLVARRAATRQRRAPCGVRRLLQARIFQNFWTSCAAISENRNPRNASTLILAKIPTFPFIFLAPAISVRVWPENSVYRSRSRLIFNGDHGCQRCESTALHADRRRFSSDRTPWLEFRSLWLTPTNRRSFSPPRQYKCF